MADVQVAINGFFNAYRTTLSRQVAGTAERGEVPKEARKALGYIASQGQTITAAAGWDRIRVAYLQSMMDMYEELIAKLGNLIDPQVRQQLLGIVRSNMADLEYLATYMAGALQGRLPGVAEGTLEAAMDVVDGLALEYRARLITVVQTGLGIFHNAVVILQGEAAGVEYFALGGPIDATTRPHCQHWVGTKFTREEYMATAGKWKRDVDYPFEMLGGYNCRHYLIALTPDLIGKYPQGPRGGAK
jgi:hypothetical protein